MRYVRGNQALLGSFAIDLVDTLLKGLTYFLSFGPLYYGSMLLHIALCAIAATTKSHADMMPAPPATAQSRTQTPAAPPRSERARRRRRR